MFVEITIHFNMLCEREEDLAMMDVDFGGPDDPLNTQFVLPMLEEKKLCPRFYGNVLDKLKVYDVLRKDMHVDVKSKWGETALFIDKRPLHKLKYATNLSRAEWMKQAEANVETWKQHNGWYNKQDAQTQTSCLNPFAEAAKQVAESAKKQEEQRKSHTSYP